MCTRRVFGGTGIEARPSGPESGALTTRLPTAVWFRWLFENSLTVGKNDTNYDDKVSAVCEATTQLVAAGLTPAKVVFFIDF
ncbi:hypothetical protein TNCV_3466721 [Trichonephila clavipes]|nr:hypothetical protein TNCV_3466721 [Trichonephila clavipes]